MSMRSYRSSLICAPLIWFEGEFRENVLVRVDESGKIAQIGTDLSPNDGETTVVLENQALLPGFINTHSHAFHRFLRGRSFIGQQAATTFWAWRDNMYALVDNIEWDTLKEYCTAVFSEMLSAGITTVGEFHYVHHGKGRFDLDSAVLEAAKEAGIRITLIQALYQRGGFASPPLAPAQERFVSSFDDFVKSVEHLDSIAHDRATIAVAAHSLRAVDETTTQRLWEYARATNRPFHIHLEEQPKEIEDCIASTGQSPSQWLLGMGVDGGATAVHATFTPRELMDSMTKAGVHISVCPCTEGYLGDGVPSVDESTPICLGTDCNNRISLLEEMRWAAFTQMAKHNSRAVAALSAVRLVEAATVTGAASLGLSNVTGKLAKGYAFDFLTIDLASPLLKDCPPSQLLDSIVFSLDNREIVQVGVDGDVRYERK
ncbi:cpin-1 [Pristionchus pacificus]|uniref:Cpin-1 n=1 Tax=Pristionchus pacificus TaxID=54126 RepID=A0A2A6BT36_PRIPA|nr:cpin-1 [Pristionchus pacificus]|eukprot:PDM69099.1 cpin-1 [Pristionchus pacificus]